LEIELEIRRIPFESKKQLTVFYKSRKINKVYIPDLYVYGGIIAELKSVKELLPEHEAQLFNYMKITKTKVGYLINFCSKDELEWKRYII
jgi:GxxExxY protein